MSIMRILIIAVGLFAMSSICDAQQTIFIVRHADKADNSVDPPLSPNGKARAKDLAKLLRNANVTAIYTSQFQRAIKTAEPLADKLGLEIKKEFTGDPASFAKLLAKQNPVGNVLVVGHSDTVPELLKSLGHSPSPPIQISEVEFDNLFMVVPTKNSAPTVVRFRYGK